MRIGMTQSGIKMMYDPDGGPWMVHWDEDRTQYPWCLDGNGFVRKFPPEELPIIETTNLIAPRNPSSRYESKGDEIPAKLARTLLNNDKKSILLVRIGRLLHELEDYLAEPENVPYPGYRFYCERAGNGDVTVLKDWTVWDKEKNMEVAGPFATYTQAEAQRDRLELIYGGEYE